MAATPDGGPPEGDSGGELDHLRELVAQHPKLPDGEVAALLRQVGEQGLDSPPRRRLAQHHLWMVLDEVVRVGEERSAADLFQEGSTALLKVVHGLAGPSVMTPAQFRAAVRRAVGETIGGALREEQEARQADEQWARDGERVALAEAALTAELERSPSDLELAAHLEWPLERTVQLRQAVHEARSQYDREMLDLLGELEEEE